MRNFTSKLVLKNSISILALGLLLFSLGCAKDSGKSNAAISDKKVSALAANTCVVTRPNGKLDDGSEGSTVLLHNEYLSQADQSIYITEEFPHDHYTIHREFNSPSRKDLLANAIAYKWEIGPAQDENGKWTKLNVWKEVLNSEDNEAYYLDLKTYDYGDEISFVDVDADLSIECNIPKN